MEFSEGRGRAARRTIVNGGYYFRVFSPFPPCSLSAWRRRLADRAGEEERERLPGAPEHRAAPAPLPLRRRRRNRARRAQHAGAGRPQRRSGERRGPGGWPSRGSAHPRLRVCSRLPWRCCVLGEMSAILLLVQQGAPCARKERKAGTKTPDGRRPGTWLERSSCGIPPAVRQLSEREETLSLVSSKAGTLLLVSNAYALPSK